MIDVETFCCCELAKEVKRLHELALHDIISKPTDPQACGGFTGLNSGRYKGASGWHRWALVGKILNWRFLRTSDRSLPALRSRTGHRREDTRRRGGKGIMLPRKVNAMQYVKPTYPTARPSNHFGEPKIPYSQRR